MGRGEYELELKRVDPQTCRPLDSQVQLKSRHAFVYVKAKSENTATCKQLLIFSSTGILKAELHSLESKQFRVCLDLQAPPSPSARRGD